MKTTDFAFDLPAELIAQTPLPERSASRLLQVDGDTASLSHLSFKDLPRLLTPDDLLVFNNTRVLPARLHAQKQTGGRVEILIERMLGDGGALAHLRSSKSPREDAVLMITESQESDISDLSVRVMGRQGSLYRLAPEAGTIKEMMRRFGHMPLPPYIEREDTAEDRERYQTLYGCRDGAVAAPTAGLHFTPELLDQLQVDGHKINDLTLSVGLGTFRPIETEQVEDHPMHAEEYFLSPSTKSVLRDNSIKKLAIGTTCVRAIEHYLGNEDPAPSEATRNEAQLFIRPPYKFLGIDHLLTNFHLPGSTLLCLAAAFLTPGQSYGLNKLKQLYKEAISQNYRFFSYGDAMLIL